MSRILIRVASIATASLLIVASPCFASPLKILNSSNSDILNIQAAPSDGREKFFMRLDLSPGASVEIDNPGREADLRVDTGLEFWTFKNINLGDAREIVLRQGDPAYMEIEESTGAKKRADCEAKKLVPQKGERPVCGLESFHPLMPMKDVCELLDPDTPVDDNGALLAGLGFAGMTWAARLAPARDESGRGETLLEHLELRRPFAGEDLSRLLAYLSKRGYAPWQAEFPGKDIDFDGDIKARENALMNAIRSFLANKKKEPRLNSSDEEPEASVMLAPADLLPALNDGDSPATDVQLFTINIRPASGVLMVDVAAYKANEDSGATGKSDNKN